MADRRSFVLRGVRDGLIVAGLLFLAYLFVVVAPVAGTVGFDAAAYWGVDLDHPYRLAAGAFGAFPYTPVMARLFSFAAGLPWPAFWWLWTAVLVATAAWLGGRRWWLAVFAFPPVAVELYHGNVHLLIAAAIALGFRYPATWALILFTKVTPGVGLLWFAVRREWRSLGIAVGATAVIAALSIAVDGRLWGEWLNGAILPVSDGTVGQPHIDIPLLVRLPIAAAVVVWGALTDRRWTVPVASAIALPVLWFAGFSILAAVPALLRPELGERRST
jgi:glycosyl transferase family 87